MFVGSLLVYKNHWLVRYIHLHCHPVLQVALHDLRLATIRQLLNVPGTVLAPSVKGPKSLAMKVTNQKPWYYI